MSEITKPSMLIVDDRKEHLLVLEMILRGLDVNIVMADSGEDALWKIKKHDFFLVILDIQMPGMDGFETANYIRSQEKNRNVPIIFITATDSASDTKVKYYLKACKANAVDYLTKPIDSTALVGKVNRLLKLHQMMKAYARPAAV